MGHDRFQTWARWFVVAVVVVLVALVPGAAWAGPGGKIASAFFKTWWGQLIGAILAIVLLPLILYVTVRERIEVARTLRDLRTLAARDRRFDWMPLHERVTECFMRVHGAWSREDMALASQWMTSWYWQNQQLAHLDRWERDGLVNQCTVKSMGAIRPLLVLWRSDDAIAGNGSRVVVSITAKMEDYLQERATGRIVEGAKGFDDEETVWTFVLEHGQWVVSNIEEGSLSLAYATMVNELTAPGALLPATHVTSPRP